MRTVFAIAPLVWSAFIWIFLWLVMLPRKTEPTARFWPFIALIAIGLLLSIAISLLPGGKP